MPVEAARSQELQTGETAVRLWPGHGRVRCKADAGPVYVPSGGRRLGPEMPTRGQVLTLKRPPKVKAVPGKATKRHELGWAIGRQEELDLERLMGESCAHGEGVERQERGGRRLS